MTNQGIDADEGWAYGLAADAAWIEPPAGDHRIRVIANVGTTHLALFEARAGYQAPAHQHTDPELLYVLHGVVESNGVRLSAGDGYSAAPGSAHRSFTVIEDAAYVASFTIR